MKRREFLLLSLSSAALADRFCTLGLIPKPVVIRDAVLTPPAA